MSAKPAINNKLQGSVATYLRCGGVVNNQIKQGLLLSLRVKIFFKSVNIWHSCKQERLSVRLSVPSIDVAAWARAADMELGHWVTGSMGHLGHLSRPGDRVIILTRCETRVFPVFEKNRYQDIYFCENPSNRQ